MASVKFCGLTRADDAREAIRIGADYVGVILAGGPRMQTPARARELLREHASARTVGVFGAGSAAEIARAAAIADVDIIQLHADPDAEAVAEVRRVSGRVVWAALRLHGAMLPPRSAELFEAADAVVLDARADHALGGTGIPLPWTALAASLATVRQGVVVLAGGLTAANVAAAVAALAPDIVDVSSGVESAPGIKDHTLMRAFIDAARIPPRAA